MAHQTFQPLTSKRALVIGGLGPKGKGFVISFVYTDKFTPTAADVSTLVGNWFPRFHKFYVNNIKRHIISSWLRMQQEKPITNPYSLIWKLGGVSPGMPRAISSTITETFFSGHPRSIRDPRALVLTGELATALEGITFSHEESGKGVITSVMSTNFPLYTAVHEFGGQAKITGKMREWLRHNVGYRPWFGKSVIKTPKRAFVARGIKEGLRAYGRMYGKFTGEVVKIFNKLPVKKPLIVTSEGGPSIFSFAQFGTVGYLLFIVPPQFSPALAAWGATGDLTSFFEGQFTPELATLYARSMLLGRFGATRKTVRRSVRGKIFGGG